MENLAQILSQEVQKYAADGFGMNMRLFPILDEKHQIYAVNAVDTPIKKYAAGVVVLARLVGDIIVIEDDNTDKPLVDALIQQGVPRSQIVLAYAGEPVPDPMSND